MGPGVWCEQPWPPNCLSSPVSKGTASRDCAQGGATAPSAPPPPRAQPCHYFQACGRGAWGPPHWVLNRGSCYAGKLVWVTLVHPGLPSPPSTLSGQHPHRPFLLPWQVSGQVDRGGAQGDPPPLHGLEDRTPHWAEGAAFLEGFGEGVGRAPTSSQGTRLNKDSLSLVF